VLKIGGESSRPAFERVGVAATATLIPSLLLVHGLAALLHVEQGKSPGAVAVSWAVVAVGLVHALVQWRWARVPMWGWIVTPTAAALWLTATVGGFAGALAVLACSTAQGWSQSRIALLLPQTIDGRFSRRRWTTVAWSLLALLAVVQTARLSSHEADPEVGWWVTTKHSDWTSHLCTPAYVYAADLHRQGETNIYDSSHYPAFDPAAEPHATVENLGAHVECSFQYPPTFLLLPWLALRFTNDFYVIRPVWLALQGLGFLAVALSLSLWVGGARGRLALWLLPAVWVAVPTLQNFQLGQFHTSTMALALAGMLAFETRRLGLGGGLLAAAVVTKIYPAVLLLLLLFQRRWRDLGTTLAWIAVLGISGLALLGAAPHRAFFDHLPHLLDGAAFDSPFWDPNTRDVMTAIKIGVSEIPGRLRLLGVTLIPAELGSWLSHALGIGILALVWRAGRRTTSRSHSVILWLALLNLVVLQGPAAFIDYVPATSLWLLSFVSLEMAWNPRIAIWLTVCWAQLSTLLGSFPTPSYPSNAQVAASSLLVTTLVLGLNLWCAMRTDSRWSPTSGGDPQHPAGEVLSDLTKGPPIPSVPA